MKRTNYLNNIGYEVFRFWKNEVQQQFKLVLDVICNYLMNDV
ncbi:DUF559 domain-containing protein [Legionella bononiensis]|nr:DUF559 domain-containing protein [Legionella bononiensis]